MDNNDEEDSSVHLGTGHHVHWNDLLPYTVPNGTEMFEGIVEEMRGALERLDLFQLVICANKFDQYYKSVEDDTKHHVLYRMSDMKLHLKNDEWTRLIGLCHELAINPPCSHAPTMDAYSSLLLRIYKLPVVKQ